MRKLFTILIVVLSTQFSFNLSAQCIEGNCVNGQGTYNYDNGYQYSGEWKDGKYHGQGTYTYGDGTSDKGIWEDGELINDLCKDMGLSPNTEAYGKCILKMMD